jgi:ferric iron reductase protein FhuF
MFMTHEMLVDLEQNYRILFRKGHSYATNKLTVEQQLADFAIHIQSAKHQVTGSLWVKRYSSLAAGCLYAFSHADYALDITPSSVRVTLTEKGLLQFDLLENGEPGFPESTLSRERKRELYYQHIFMDHIGPLFQEVQRLTAIDMGTLWSTLSYLLAYWVRIWKKVASSETLRARIQEDYEALLEQVEALSAQFRTVSSPLAKEEPILIRNKCCLNYCLPGEDRYCYTCPRITDERRMEKYLAAHGVPVTTAGLAK